MPHQIRRVGPLSAGDERPLRVESAYRIIARKRTFNDVAETGHVESPRWVGSGPKPSPSETV